MIYTVTFNPALDYAMGVKRLEPGMTNRSYYEQLLPSGKGLNVSTIRHTGGCVHRYAFLRHPLRVQSGKLCVKGAL